MDGPGPSIKIFGREFAEGRRLCRSKEIDIEYTVEKCRAGFKVTGKARGRLGRVEVFRGRAPRDFLLNNWQSWGPLQKMRPGERHQGIEEVMRKYSPSVFTPVPAIFEKNLRLAREGFPFDVFQVDDGFEKDIGDWLTTKDGFRPLPDLARLITCQGFTAGIWTAPFSAAETCGLFQEHSDWMVQEAGAPKECYRNWGKRIYALDTTRSDVKEWLGQTFSALRRMGFSYFKVDFLFAAAMPGERAEGGTPVQANREGMKTIRQADGDGFILGCGAPLLPSADFVEGKRIGEDTAPHWDSKRGAFQGPNAYYALKNSIMRSFLHRRLWLNDPDCLLLRSKDISLTPNERELYALAVGTLDNMVIESDDLALVDERGKELLRMAVSLQGGQVSVRGLMDHDIYVIRSQGGPAGDVRLLANLSDRWNKLESIEVPPRSARILQGLARGASLNV